MWFNLDEPNLEVYIEVSKILKKLKEEEPQILGGDRNDIHWQKRKKKKAPTSSPKGTPS